jgi:hypothetical protein
VKALGTFLELLSVNTLKAYPILFIVQVTVIKHNQFSSNLTLSRLTTYIYDIPHS